MISYGIDLLNLSLLALSTLKRRADFRHALVLPDRTVTFMMQAIKVMHKSASLQSWKRPCLENK